MLLFSCWLFFNFIRKEIKMNIKKEKMKNLEEDKEIELKCLGPNRNV